MTRMDDGLRGNFVISQKGICVISTCEKELWLAGHGWMIGRLNLSRKIAGKWSKCLGQSTVAGPSRPEFD